MKQDTNSIYFFILCLLVSVASSSCKMMDSYSAVKITNPEPVPRSSYPEVVMLLTELPDGKRYACSGTFVAKNTILTAAHCFFDKNGARIIRLTYTDAQGSVHEGQVFPSRSYKSSDKKNRVYSDLGLVKFDRDVSEHFAEISKGPLNLDDEIIMVGYGQTNTIEGTGAGDKKMGKNKIVSLDQNTFNTSGYAQDRVDGARRGIRSATGVGDSGGPVFDAKNGKLIGVTSNGRLQSKIDPQKQTELKESWFVNLTDPKSTNILREIQNDMCSNRSMPMGKCLPGSVCSIQ